MKCCDFKLRKNGAYVCFLSRIDEKEKPFAFPPTKKAERIEKEDVKTVEDEGRR